MPLSSCHGASRRESHKKTAIVPVEKRCRKGWACVTLGHVKSTNSVFREGPVFFNRCDIMKVETLLSIRVRIYVLGKLPF